MISAYVKHGQMDQARELFDSLESPNVSTWNSMIKGYAQLGHIATAVDFLKRMDLDGIQPNTMTLLTLFDACATIPAPAEGKLVHASVDRGFDRDGPIATALVYMYGRSGGLDAARAIFDRLPDRDVAPWTAMIASYAHNGHGAAALELFQRMALDGSPPNAVTFNTILCAELVSWNAMISAAAKNGDLALARDLFSRMPERDVISWTALFAEVAQTGELDQAKHLFDRIPEHNDIAWNAMIAAYAQNGHGEEALEIFRTMDLEGVFPNRATFVSTLDACTISKSSAKMGRFLLAELHCLGYHGGDIRLDTAQINLLGKIGSLAAAVEIFAGVIDKNDICWNSMIAAYATNGHIEEAMASLSAMTLDGFHPNEITFRIVLGALSHAGLMDPSWDLFVSSARDYSIRPAMEHYVCIVDLLARVGRLSEARDLIARMPFHPDPVAWTALLGACKLQEERDLGEFAAAMLVQLNSENDSPYVVLSHLYSKDG
ncbi:hypothetical protein SELMODRAFT_76039 [Selaginella moellendorffii]|uniref:Pentacotripeptide-repeat region of PRORP domain-containing protein n=1 Tax=Selaginella moellendorffii TaxID=88036 RepID=D8QS53_SELML|nr:hypothetical protein SELMODRAFT_76039 [Selaginella moellendorffii]